MTRKSLAFLIGATGFSLGCAVRAPEPPAPTRDVQTLVMTGSVDRTEVDLRNSTTSAQHVLPVSLSTAWEVLPEVFERLGIEPTTVRASAGIMGNDGARVRTVEGRRMSTYIDCGRAAGRTSADVYQVTLSIMVQLFATADGATAVRTTTDAYARDRAQSTNPVHCHSWGVLERRVGELVAELTATPGA